MYEDIIGSEKCLPRQQDKCRERHVQAAINAPLYMYKYLFKYIINILWLRQFLIQNIFITNIKSLVGFLVLSL